MVERRIRKGNDNKIASKNKSNDECKNTKEKIVIQQYDNYNLAYKTLARLVVITSLLVVVCYTTYHNKVQPFVKWSDQVMDGRVRIVQCSSEYMNEVDKFEGCVPHQCKRVVHDKVMTDIQSDALLDLAQRGLKLGGSQGGASILDLHSGALSQGNHFINIYKNKAAKDIFSNLHFEAYKQAAERMRYAVAYYFQVHPEKIYLTHPTFFSELTAKDPVTLHDEYWHPHVDKETYKSFHFTTLLYLNDYGIDFEGGRFVFIDNWANSTVEPKKSRVSMFTSGKENYHYVERVTKGVRYAMTISFTCDKKYAINEPDIENFNK